MGQIRSTLRKIGRSIARAGRHIARMSGFQVARQFWRVSAGNSRDYSRQFGDMLRMRGAAFGDDGSSRATELVRRLSKAGQQTMARAVRGMSTALARAGGGKH